MRPAVLTLADGRRLTWYEFGDPGGSPVIYTAGTPESGLAGACYDDAAAAAGLRWISPDKPGYGGSDFQRGRSLTDWAADVIALAGQLGLDRFALAGESGGAPFTLAAAHRLGERRVTVVALIAPMGQPEPGALAGMRRGNRLLFWLARHAPAAAGPPLSLMAAGLRDPVRRDRLAARGPARGSEVRLRLDAAADAVSQGTRATIQELTLIVRPWGFRPAEVGVPVHLWHGTRDTNVPIALAERLAAVLPRATTHFSADAGHDVGLVHRAELMSVLSSAMH